MINFAGLKLNNLDDIMLVNRKFQIVYYSRFDDSINETQKYNLDDYVGRNLFEVYPSLQKENSSIVTAIVTGEVVVKRFQKFIDFSGKLFCTHNITIPLIRKGQIVGALELSNDVTTVQNIEDCSLENFDATVKNIMKKVDRQEDYFSFDNILTQNSYMKKCIERAKILARLPNPVLIYGETGTGKELFAQAMISYNGIDRKKVVVQNCAAVPDNLIESILFGTVKGAYTGAETRKGLFEEADGGIFFLDELNSLPFPIQGKLLRVLQDGTFRPVGSNKEKKVDVKIIAAMNVDPKVAIENKELRKDLFYRLNSGIIYLMPLRERKDDIEYFTEYYIKDCNKTYGRNIKGITQGLKEFFKGYLWDGNVRELKHLIESMVSVTELDVLDIHHLPAYLYDTVCTQKENTTELKGIHNEKVITFTIEESIGDRISKNGWGKDTRKNFDLKGRLKEAEKNIIKDVLKETNGNKTKASEILGIPRQTLNYRIKILNLDIKS
nr:sigma 54-interacting transcriptional regulator [uncultured Aminipila sp.]